METLQLILGFGAMLLIPAPFVLLVWLIGRTERNEGHLHGSNTDLHIHPPYHFGT